MRVAVMGAGAVGCYYGAMLARAGHDVTLVGRARHVDAIRGAGLLLDMQGFHGRVPLGASTEASAVEGADLVLFCVKSTDTAAAGADMARHLGSAAVVLGMQNGVDNADRLRAVLARDGAAGPGSHREVIAAAVYVAAEMAGPGHVRHHGRGELVIGRSPASARIAAEFAACGVPTELSDNVADVLWAKLILNCAFNALSALSGLPYGRLIRSEGVEAVMRDVVQECLAVARGSGVAVPGDAWGEVQRIAATMPGQMSSTAQDLARGRRSEIDHLNGYVVRQGESLGLAVPANRALHTLVKLLERTTSAPSHPSDS